ncbi:hypothetical protein ACX801_13010 [Arthrobacter bambusae]
MISILSQRIRTICDEDLKWFREQVFALADQDAFAEGVEGVGVATAMQQKPSMITRGLSVEVVGFTQRNVQEANKFMVSVSLYRHSNGSPANVYWEEAHAWADAIAHVLWTTAEFNGSQETPSGKSFHYVLEDFEAPPSLRATAVVL